MCKHPAGFRTPHLGEGRCWLHGGLTPVKHGRFSTIKRQEIRKLYEEFAADPDPLNLLDELALMRALTRDYIERYDGWREAVLAWHASWEMKVALPQDLLQDFRSLVEEYEIMLREGAEPTKRQAEMMAGARKYLDIMGGRELAGKPRQILDLADAVRLLDRIGVLVERIEKIRSADAISRPKLLSVMDQIARIILLRVMDGDTRAAIKDDLLGITI